MELSIQSGMVLQCVARFPALVGGRIRVEIPADTRGLVTHDGAVEGVRWCVGGEHWNTVGAEGSVAPFVVLVGSRNELERCPVCGVVQGVPSELAGEGVADVGRAEPAPAPPPSAHDAKVWRATPGTVSPASAWCEWPMCDGYWWVSAWQSGSWSRPVLCASHRGVVSGFGEAAVLSRADALRDDAVLCRYLWAGLSEPSPPFARGGGWFRVDAHNVEGSST